MRIAFFGTPDFAVPSLDSVAREHEIVAVIAQPDKPAGRGMQVQAPPVAQRAAALGLRVMQPPRVRDPQFLEELASLRPDAGVVIAYGKILPASLLAIPRHGFFNVHGSILPKYRGAAPIQRAIAAGETTTGVTIMRLDEELDHGAMLGVATLEIGADERAPELSRRLSQLGAEALLPVLRDVEQGTATEEEQDHARATFAPKIDKAEGAIDWSAPAASTYNRFRAFDPWPGAFFVAGSETIKVAEMRPVAGRSAMPGEIVALDEGVDVATADGTIRLLVIQRPGKSRAPAADVARGLRWNIGDVLR